MEVLIRLECVLDLAFAPDSACKCILLDGCGYMSNTCCGTLEWAVVETIMDMKGYNPKANGYYLVIRGAKI